jgi:ATP-binding cassette, subfamily B, bacterial
MEKEKDSRIPFLTPFQYMVFVSKPHWPFVIGALFIIALAAGLSQSTSYLFKLIVDAVEQGRIEHALWWGLAFPVAVFVTQCLYRLDGVLTMQWSTRSVRDGYEHLFAHVLKHSHSYFINRFAGSIHNKIRNVVDGFDRLILDAVWTFTDALISVIVTFAFIFFVDRLSAILFLVLVVTLIVLNRFLAPRKLLLAKVSASMSSELHANMIDVVSNVSATRQFAQRTFETQRLSQFINNFRTAHVASWMYTEWMLFVNGFVLFLFGSAMFYVLITRWSTGAVSTGDFILVASLISHLSGTLIFIGRVFNNAARTLGEIREGFAELLIDFDIVDAPDAQPLVVGTGAIAMDAMTFDYDKHRIFDQFDLRINAGERIGLVGPSGAGKTTLVSLLMRQYDVTQGSIRINDTDIRAVTQDSLRAAIAVVPQEPTLLHRTIRENIAYGKHGATEEEVVAAATRAQAHEFIEALPQGYDTLVGERGVKLSGGQKQRIAIARAMIKDAPILILDEATSALDSESEVEIQKALHELMAGKTVVAIAHRLSTLREMDRIIVLEAGKIVEDGSHETLKDAGGTYARLWNHQAGGFLQDDATEDA